jgi:hypothetical protein
MNWGGAFSIQNLTDEGFDLAERSALTAPIRGIVSAESGWQFLGISGNLGDSENDGPKT